MAEDDLKQKMRAFDGEVAIAVAQLYLVHMLQRPLPAGFITPCLPTKTDKLPSGSQWLHEIKHDGFRIIARKTGAQVRLYSRPANDLTRRFPMIVETLARLRARSCIIDGEAVACDDSGVASFELVRHQRANGSVFLYAFDLIELNSDDLRRDPLEVRKATLRSIRTYRRRRPDYLRARLPARPRRHRLQAQGLKLSLRPLARLAEDEEPSGSGGEARRRGGLGQAAMTGKNRIMIYGPKTDGTYVVEFRTAQGAVLAISIPRTEAAVIRHFQERMPYGLFVADEP